MSETRIAGSISFGDIGKYLTATLPTGDRVTGRIADVSTGTRHYLPQKNKYGERRRLRELVHIKLSGGVGVHLPYGATVDLSGE